MSNRTKETRRIIVDRPIASLLHKMDLNPMTVTDRGERHSPAEYSRLSRQINDSKIFVLDGRTLSCLAFTRSLGAAGATVHVGESFRRSISPFSRYATKQHEYPSAEEKPDEFRSRVLEIADKEQYDFIIPTRDATTRSLATIQDVLPKVTNTLLSTPENIDTLNHKGQCAKLAEQVGVPIPATYFPSEKDIEAIAAEAEFPVLIKPTVSSGARGIVRVDRPERLGPSYESVTARNGPAIVQEFIDHSGGHFSIGTVFDRNSQPRAVHVYEELVQYPDSGGPAVEAISVAPEPWVDEMLELLRAIDWVGPAHMDVLLDPSDGTHKLLEVNPRTWMSVNLTIQSGVDVPKIAVGIAKGEYPDPVTSYRTDLRYRWMLPNEFLWMMSGDRKRDRFLQIINSRSEPTCFGVLSSQDPKATLGVFVQGLSFIFDKEKRKSVLGRGWEDD